MPSAETEALALATREDGSLDIERYNAEYKRGLAERQEKLARDAQALLRAADGWGAMETQEDATNALRKADEDLQSGAFLVERLGGQRYIDPAMMAALYVLRRQLIRDHGADTAAESMMIDSALLAHSHMLRINGWLGDLAVAVETEMFGRASLTARLDERHGRGTTVRGLRVEELVQRMSEQLMPLLERSNRMMLRNLKALKEQRRAPAPNVNINQARQVNVGNQQVNVAPDAE